MLKKKKANKNLYRRHDTHEDKEKRFVMWTGVCFFMTIIVVIWGFNTKKIFAPIEARGNKINFEGISSDFDKLMQENKEILENLGKDIEKELNKKEDSEDLENKIEELKNDLENNYKKASSTIDIATSTEQLSTSTIEIASSTGEVATTSLDN